MQLLAGGLIPQPMGINSITDKIGLDLSFTIILLTLLHHLEQLPITTLLIMIQILTNEHQRDIENTPSPRQHHLLTVTLALLLRLGLETCPVTALELVEGAGDCLGVDYPVDCLQDAPD